MDGSCDGHQPRGGASPFPPPPRIQVVLPPPEWPRLGASPASQLGRANGRPRRDAAGCHPGPRITKFRRCYTKSRQDARSEDPPIAPSHRQIPPGSCSPRRWTGTPVLSRSTRRFGAIRVKSHVLDATWLAPFALPRQVAVGRTPRGWAPYSITPLAPFPRTRSFDGEGRHSRPRALV